MRVVVTGAGGFLGRRLVQTLLQEGTLPDRHGKESDLVSIVAVDRAKPEGLPQDRRLESRAADVSDAETVQRLILGDNGDEPADGIFHLAAVVSAQAEQDYDLGMRVNLDGTRYIVDACRQMNRPARMVFASSCGVYSGDPRKPITDTTSARPLTSYGTQKRMGELLLCDAARRGFLDARSLRLPTIVVRPGKPNKAASSFASAVIREPLAHDDYVCPVPRDTQIFIRSPRKMIEAFLHAFRLSGPEWGANRVLTLPGITVSVDDMLAALRRMCGDVVADRVRFEPDASIVRIVRTWPPLFDLQRAENLGFGPETSMDAIIQEYLDDENIRVPLAS